MQNYIKNRKLASVNYQYFNLKGYKLYPCIQKKGKKEEKNDDSDNFFKILRKNRQNNIRKKYFYCS